MKTLKTLLVGLSFVMASAAFAFDPDFAAMEDGRLMQRFPQGSISTRETADQALREVRAAKSRLKELSEYSRRRCNENIFVNSCIDDVRKAELRQSRRLQAIEAEARRFVREDDARKEALKQQKRDERAAQPPKKVQRSAPRAPTEAQKKAQENREMHAKRMQSLKDREQQALKKQAEAEQKRAEYEKKAAQLEQRRAKREKALEKRAKEKEKKQAKQQKREAQSK